MGRRMVCGRRSTVVPFPIVCGAACADGRELPVNARVHVAGRTTVTRSSSAFSSLIPPATSAHASAPAATLPPAPATASHCTRGSSCIRAGHTVEAHHTRTARCQAASAQYKPDKYRAERARACTTACLQSCMRARVRPLCYATLVLLASADAQCGRRCLKGGAEDKSRARCKKRARRCTNSRGGDPGTLGSQVAAREALLAHVSAAAPAYTALPKPSPAPPVIVSVRGSSAAERRWVAAKVVRGPVAAPEKVAAPAVPAPPPATAKVVHAVEAAVPPRPVIERAPPGAARRGGWGPVEAPSLRVAPHGAPS